MTTTLKLTAEEIAALRQDLNTAGFEFRRLDHAHFQARGEGVVVNAYRSGKVVVQGKGEATFLRARGLATTPPPSLDEPVAGSDESGKGDYFGPLVVSAVVVDPSQEAALAEAGVRDSKQMSDTATHRAAAAIRQLCPHAVCALNPTEYNEHHERDRNVALFLAQKHAEALAAAIKDAPACARVVIDQFTFAERLEDALKQHGVDLPVEIRPRAEDNPAVAAASVLARSEFLLGLRDLGTEYGLELPKGAGQNVETVGRRFFQDYGIEALRAVAKIHFKTTKRVTENLF
ncbi:MAG: ribonuclease HIII [Planctomycetota bacterium]|jgi:ribonuclease HIII